MPETNASDPFQLLKDLVAAPSPSGYEEPAQEAFRTYCASFADEVRTDVIGNAYAIINPAGSRKIMLAGHVDEIGFLVTHITSAGFIYFDPIGGQDATVTVGQRVRVHTASHGSLLGVVGKKPIHLLTPEERGKKTELAELYIDIGAQNGVEVDKLVSIGDPITYATEFTHLAGDLAASRGFDNKTGTFVVAEALRIVKERGGCSSAVYGVSTVQEEVGQRGAKTAAHSINAEIGIAIDVGHATDCPGTDKRHVGDVRLGGGPILTRGTNINPEVFRRLVEAAAAEQIPVQIVARPGATRTDAAMLQVSQSGMATGLIGVPLRYMHSPGEVVALSDVANAAKLLARFIIDVLPDADFLPKTRHS